MVLTEERCHWEELKMTMEPAETLIGLPMSSSPGIVLVSVSVLYISIAAAAAVDDDDDDGDYATAAS